MERIEEPLLVVDVFQVEEPWIKKVDDLEREIARWRGEKRVEKHERHEPAP